MGYIVFFIHDGSSLAKKEGTQGLSHRWRMWRSRGIAVQSPTCDRQCLQLRVDNEKKNNPTELLRRDEDLGTSWESLLAGENVRLILQ